MSARSIAALALIVLVLLYSAKDARADLAPAMSPRTIALPSGAGSMKGLGESFSPNLSTGAGNFSLPLELPPGLGKPSLSLQYSHGRGRTEVGASFSLPRLSIYRTRDKGSPEFKETDRFAVAGPSFTDELVQVNADARYYRLKNEGSFALFVRDAQKDNWTIHYSNGDIATLGGSDGSRQWSVRGSYKWFLTTYLDASGNETAYAYFSDRAFVYLDTIRYRLKAVGFENEVKLIYEPREDPFTDYGYGSAVTCAQRLSRIEMRSGCGASCVKTVRTYLLGYSKTTQSFLSSVTQIGMGGTPDVTMPTLSFRYVEPSSALGATVSMAGSVPLDLVELGRAQLDDVNGDGLPDVIVGAAFNYSYYENQGGWSWGDAAPLSRSPDVSLDDGASGVVLADVNGDGFRDIVRTNGAEYLYFPGGNVVAGKFLGYRPAVHLASPPSAPSWSAGGSRLADLNFDGRTDILRSDGTHALKDLNVKDGLGEHVQESPDVELPIDVARLFSSPSSLQMHDFNGDGAQDFVINEISWGDSRLRVFYGLGGGKFTPSVAIAAPKGNRGDFLLGDINDDGYLDLVRYTGQQITYWLGAGDERFLGPYGPNAAWSAPSRSEARSVQLIDMDGSGTSDLVILTRTGQVVYVSLFSNPFLGLLSQIDNGMGMVTSLSYRTSSQYATDAKMAGLPWRTTLPRPIAVVSEMSVTDSLDKVGLPATVKMTRYEYAEGYYDGREREFRGFGFVRAIEPGDDHDESRVTETWMHVGVNPETGADEEILKGKPYRLLVKNAAGDLYTSEETRWSMRWLCAEDGAEFQTLLPKCALYPNKDEAKDSLVALAVQDWTLKGVWEKTNAPRYTLETRVHDAWGQVTQNASFGEVALPATRVPGDPFDVDAVSETVPGDEVIATTSYIESSSLSGDGGWLIGLPYATETRDRAMNVLAAHRTYYDGAPFVGSPLGRATRGKAMRRSSCLTPAGCPRLLGRWIDTQRFAVDDYGLVTVELDANGNHTTTTYDDETHSFAVREAIEVEGGRTLAWGAKHDPAFGSITRSTDLDGNAWDYTYDGLGRLTAIVDPLSSAALPTVTYAYAYGTRDNPVSKIVDRHLVDRGKGTYQVTFRYLDAAGEPRLTKTPNDRGDGYVASGFGVKSALGAEVLHYRDFATAALGLEIPPASTPFAETYHDAIGRPTRAFSPASGARHPYTLTTYLPFEVRVFDEQDTAEGTWLYPAVTRADGLGRIRQKVRYNDYAGASGGMERTALEWTYTYDPMGSLVAWTDPGKNVREYAYDSLARLTEVHDPNLGTILYAHDDFGNVTGRVDLLGQTRTMTFGAANRMQAVRVAHDAHGRPDYEYRYHYDVARADGPLAGAANLVGRVAWTEWPAGSSYVSYDELGRVTTEAESIWDPARSTFDAQVRDTFRADHTYNAVGWREHTTLPGGHGFAWTYGLRGKIETLASDRAGAVTPHVTAIDYDLEGQARRMALANGTVSCAWFNERTELTAVASGPSASVSCASDPTRAIPGAFQQVVYGRDGARDINSVTDLSTNGGLPRVDAVYTYDRLHELTAAVTSRGTDSYAYDLLQNVIRHDSTVPGTGAALGELRYGEGGAGPHRLTSAGGASFAYDVLGNMKSYDGYALTFDGEGRLSSAESAGAESVYNYFDTTGARRINVIARPDAAPEVHRFVFGGYEIRNGEEVWTASGGRVQIEIHRAQGGVDEVRYAYRDHLNGTSHVTDDSGTLLAFQQFGPYGELTSRIGKPAHDGYAGSANEPDEALKLVHFGARFYAPALGRWISADAHIGESPMKALERPLETNLYTYVSNDPINGVDPAGTENGAAAAPATPEPIHLDFTDKEGTSITLKPGSFTVLAPDFKHGPDDAAFTEFKTKVYFAHHRRVLDRHSTFDGVGVPSEQRTLIGGSNDEGPLSLRHDAAQKFKELQAAARKAGIRLTANSGYRSPGYDFGIWDRNFQGYYDELVKSKAIKRGDYSDRAVEVMLTRITPAKAMPGFSNHTKAIAFDVHGTASYKQSSPTRESDWAKQEAFRWAITEGHAAEFGFHRIDTEPWHWEYKPTK